MERIDRIEKQVEQIDDIVKRHLIESENIRAMVVAHDKRIMNGDWAELTANLRDVSDRLLKLETRLLSKTAVWRDIGFGVGLLSTLIGVLYTISRLQV